MRQSANTGALGLCDNCGRIRRLSYCHSHQSFECRQCQRSRYHHLRLKSRKRQPHWRNDGGP
jgi:hypothetical protein